MHWSAYRCHRAFSTQEFRIKSAICRSIIPVAVLVLYWLIAMTSTHWPSPDLPRLANMHLDKVAHFCIYAVLATLLIVVWQTRSPASSRQSWSPTRKYMVVWIVAVAYGVIDELTQPWFGRDCDIWDWVADGLGAFTAILICAWFLQRTRSQRS